MGSMGNVVVEESNKVPSQGITNTKSDDREARNLFNWLALRAKKDPKSWSRTKVGMLMNRRTRSFPEIVAGKSLFTTLLSPWSPRTARSLSLSLWSKTNMQSLLVAVSTYAATICWALIERWTERNQTMFQWPCVCLCVRKYILK